MAVHAAILNALNLAGYHLPRALGLLIAEMSRNSPWLHGTSADAVDMFLEPPTAPQLTAWSAWPLVFLSDVFAALTAAGRILWLAVLFTPIALSAPLALAYGFKREEWMELFRATLEAAGPAFIKWGQWAATRHDLFPPDMCSALEALHTAAPAHHYRHTARAVKHAFGMPVEDLFQWIEHTPLASGSIGQIHRARLTPKGARMTGCRAGSLVAVKVRHPHVGDAIERDFKAMVWLAAAASKVFPAARQIRLEDTLKQFAAPLHEQVSSSCVWGGGSINTITPSSTARGGKLNCAGVQEHIHPVRCS